MFSARCWAVGILSLVLVGELSLGLELVEKSEALMVTEGEPFQLNCAASKAWQWCYWTNENGEDGRLSTAQGIILRGHNAAST